MVVIESSNQLSFAYTYFIKYNTGTVLLSSTSFFVKYKNFSQLE